MKPSLQRLHKIFKEEARRGYNDRTVIGGFMRMLGPWEAEARADGVPEGLIQVIVARLRDYNRLNPTARKEILQGIWQRIQEKGEAPSDTKPIPKEKKPPEEPVVQPPPSKEKTVVEKVSKAPTAIKKKEAAPQKSPPQPPPLAPSAEKKTIIPPPEKELAALNAPVTVLVGVGPKHGQTLGRLGLKTLGDMLYFFPRRYDDYSTLKPIGRLWYGEEVTIIGVVQNVMARPVRGGRNTLVEAIISDGSGALRVSWFNPYVEKRLRAGMPVKLSGKIDQYLGRLTMSNPEFEPLEQQDLHTNRIVPVYPLTANITQRWLRKMLHDVVTFWAGRVSDFLPEEVKRAAGLLDLSTALLQMHFPNSAEQLKAARHRLAFDEIFLLQLGMLGQKRAWQERPGRIFQVDEIGLQRQLSCLPFALTGAQQRTLADIRADLERGRPMNRLLQGDVGSGKTVIAALAIAIITRQHSQAALMAPTSILAEQHYRTLLKLLAGVEIQPSQEETTLRPGKAGEELPPLSADEIRLMIGATPEAEKRAIREGLAKGTIKVVVGTHALIEEPVTFADLQLAIVDEQHRFGVEQRATLRSKGENPHLLVMTATPIPRSLALTVHGDLDLSVIDEMPPGRQMIDTHILTPSLRERAYSLIRREIKQGRQAFVIYPLVEEGENGRNGETANERAQAEAGKAAVEEYQRLQREIFPEFKLGLLHGRLRPDEKDGVMTRFRQQEYHLLVSTTVVEVGVDIPNATVMLVEGANRFGLAQLHQLRGRVGRGAEKSYCLLIPETEDRVENERLAAMAETNDGFILAERDLEQRGPGDFLGTRQAGFVEQLRLASLSDVRLIEKARRFAQQCFDSDPDLAQPEHRLLAAAMRRFWGEKGEVS